MKAKDWIPGVVSTVVGGIIILFVTKGCEKSESLVDKNEFGKLVCALCSNGSIQKGDTICFEYKCALATSFQYNNETYSATIVSKQPIEFKSAEPNPNAVMAPASAEITTDHDQALKLPIKSQFGFKAPVEPFRIIELKDSSNKEVPRENWQGILRDLKESGEAIKLEPASK